MVADNNKKTLELSSEEQATTGVYKLQSKQINTLKRSLKKTQDKLEEMREEKHKREKENAVLKHKQESMFWIELSKFLSSAGFGFSIGYLFIEDSNYYLGLSILISSLIIFIISLVFSNK